MEKSEEAATEAEAERNRCLGLKGKRRVANSLKQKVRNTFNVAIAEAGTEESLVRLRLQVVSVSNSERHLQSRMDKCLLMMEAVCEEEMTYSDLEFFYDD